MRFHAKELEVTMHATFGDFILARRRAHAPGTIRARATSAAGIEREAAIEDSWEKRVYGLRALPPALALADLYADRDGWHPDPDNLDIPDQDRVSVSSAVELLGLPL